MTILTKDQIGKLSPEQQETLAMLELKRFGRRQRLLNEARGRGKFFWIPAAICALFLLAFFFFPADVDKHVRVYVLTGISCLLSTVAVPLICMDKRLNSLIELLDLEGNTPAREAETR